MQYWLMKSEPSSYSIDDLKRDKKTPWDGVRNYQARNFLQEMQVGDKVLFYHSNTKTPAVVGIAKVVKKAQPDETQFDKKDDHYDPKATREKPIWYCPEVAFVKKLKEPVTLEEVKHDPKLNDMVLTKRSRLSVQPVSKKHFEYITEE